MVVGILLMLRASPLITFIGGYRPGQARALPWLFTCETPPSPPTLGRACIGNNEIHDHNCGEPRAVIEFQSLEVKLLYFVEYV